MAETVRAAHALPAVLAWGEVREAYLLWIVSPSAGSPRRV